MERTAFFRFFQIDLTAIIGSFFPESEDLIAWLYRGGRKETNVVIILLCNSTSGACTNVKFFLSNQEMQLVDHVN